VQSWLTSLTWRLCFVPGPLSNVIRNNIGGKML